MWSQRLYATNPGKASRWWCSALATTEARMSAGNGSSSSLPTCITRTFHGYSGDKKVKVKGASMAPPKK